MIIDLKWLWNWFATNFKSTKNEFQIYLLLVLNPNEFWIDLLTFSNLFLMNFELILYDSSIPNTIKKTKPDSTIPNPTQPHQTKLNYTNQRLIHTKPNHTNQTKPNNFVACCLLLRELDWEILHIWLSNFITWHSLWHSLWHCDRAGSIVRVPSWPIVPSMFVWAGGTDTVQACPV